MDEYISLISKSILFSGIKISNIQQAIAFLNGKIHNYKKGDIIHKAYTPLVKFGLVLKGVVNVCCDDFDGNSMILNAVEKGKTFGESLYILKKCDSPMYAYSVEDSVILWLNCDNIFNNQSKDYDLLRINFTKMLAERTLLMNSRIQALSKLKLRDKIVTYLSEYMSKAGSKTFNIPLNRENMAAYLGTDRTSLSRELSRMKNEGIIDYYKNTFKIL